VGHAQWRGEVVVVGAVSVGESVSTGRCDVCASVKVEGSGQDMARRQRMIGSEQVPQQVQHAVTVL